MPDSQLKLLAAAIYEIRTLLSPHLGSDSDSEPEVRLAAHLAYALHNDALSVLEGPGHFDVQSASDRTIAAERIAEGRFSDQFGLLRSSEN